ncbi:MAG: HNH endonuclease [Deltaproteobacteria bacterium]|nr:HNH endonuclease [Deltaproteobacteria bacterium]
MPTAALPAALEARVLVLNRSFQPVAVTRAGRAFGLLCSGAARALDREFRLFDLSSWQELAAEVGDDVIRTPRMVLKVPRVVVLQAYDRMPKRQIRFSRQNVYLRDNFTCQYCGRQFARAQLNLDHVVPRSQGGRTSWQNVVCSCVRCNLDKGGRTPAQAGLKLLSQPKRPSWTTLAQPSSGKVPYAEWLPFIDPVSASYWNAELEDE